MKHNDKNLMSWYKVNLNSLLLMTAIFMFSFTQTTAQCEWTVIVSSESTNQDEISWELTDADGEIVLESEWSPANPANVGTFIVEAEGPLEFYITTQGLFGDNRADYTISNGIMEVASGHLIGGEEVTETDLICGVAENCSDAVAGETMEDFSICADRPFTLETQGVSTGEAGISYQWEESVEGDNWSDIAGADSKFYTVSDGIENPMFYRLTVSCEFGESDTSDAIEVSLNDSLECYCIPTYTVGCSSTNNINNVSLSGETESINNDSECSDDDYGDYTDLTPADLAPGETYSLSVSTPYPLPTYEQVRAWIDYNQDGEFTDDEEIANTEGDGLADGTRDFEFDVPEDANPGDYRMRVRMVYGSSAPDFDACSAGDSGETEDYTVEILQLDVCQGTLTAGTINEDDFNICADEAFTLSVSGASDPANGLSRVWQSSPQGEDDWTDIDGAASTTYTVEGGIDEPTDFRYKVVCANSDEMDISNVLTLNLNPGNECYCTPIYSSGCSSGDRIANVSLIGESDAIDNNSQCSEDDFGDYTDLTPADLVPEGIYTLSVSTDYNYPGSEQVRAWIDYDQDGQFSDDEEIANTAGGGMGDGTRDFEFTVPEDVASGEYRMRVRLVYSFAEVNFDACSNENSGETEDYTVEILQLEDCEGRPTAGTINQEELSVCAANAFSVSVSGASEPAIGLERNWQSSPEGEEDWTNIEGATSNTYTVVDGIEEPTDFRYKVTCTNNDESSISDAITVSLNPGIECYCTPIYLTGCSSGDRISNVSLAGETESINNDSECSENGYGDYTDLAPADLIPGQTYTLNVSTDYSSPTSEEVRAWIDYNQDGEFSDDEEVANTHGDGLEGGTQSFDFAVPVNSDAGSYRMRVRLMYSSNDGNACESVNHGEVEDYTVELLDAPSCVKPYDLVVNYESDNSAQISWEANGAETEWEVSYGEPGFEPIEDGNMVIVENEPKTIIENLEPDTDYEVYVRALCSVDEQSFFTGPVAFTTFADTAPQNTYLCEAILLTANDGCQNGPYSNVGAFEEVDEPVGSCLTNFHGTNTVWFSFFGPTNGEATITTDFPEMELNTEIVVFEAPTDCEDLNTLGEEVGCASSSESVELTDLIPGNIYFVKVAGFNNAEGEFCIEVQTDGDTPEPCPAPSDIIVEVGEQSVDVTWTPGGEEDQWTVLYGEAGFNPTDEGEMVIVNDSPETTLTDLEPETDYDVYVMANCENDNTSEMVGPETFNSGNMSVEDYLFEDFTYYPNPVKDQLTLKAGTQIESITVYNLLGQTILTENPNQLETQLNIESLQAGVYLMKVSLNGSEKSFRVIKI